MTSWEYVPIQSDSSMPFLETYIKPICYESFARTVSDCWVCGKHLGGGFYCFPLFFPWPVWCLKKPLHWRGMLHGPHEVDRLVFMTTTPSWQNYQNAVLHSIPCYICKILFWIAEPNKKRVCMAGKKQKTNWFCILPGKHVLRWTPL